MSPFCNFPNIPSFLEWTKNQEAERIFGQSDAQTLLGEYSLFQVRVWKSIVLGEILEIDLFLSGINYINIVILKKRLIFIFYTMK